MRILKVFIDHNDHIWAKISNIVSKQSLEVTENDETKFCRSTARGTGWECCKFSKAGPKIQVLQIAWVNIELKHFELKLSNWSISIISRNLLVDNYIISITIA